MSGAEIIDLRAALNMGWEVQGRDRELGLIYTVYRTTFIAPGHVADVEKIIVETFANDPRINIEIWLRKGLTANLLAYLHRNNFMSFSRLTKVVRLKSIAPASEKLAEFCEELHFSQQDLLRESQQTVAAFASNPVDRFSKILYEKFSSLITRSYSAAARGRIDSASSSGSESLIGARSRSSVR